MDEKRAIEIVKKQKAKEKAISITGIILIILLLVFVDISWIFKLLSAILIFIIMIALTIYNDTRLKKILTVECNPQLYYVVRKGINPKINDIPNDIITAYFIGDFGTAYQLAETIYNKLPPKAKPLYLGMMQRILFASGDLEQCKMKTDEMTLLINSLKYNDTARSTFLSACEFYTAFINCSYEESMLALKKIKDLKNVANSFHAQTTYYEALTEYYYGDMEKAKSLFLQILNDYPDMTFFVTKAKEYITAIERGITLQLRKTELTERNVKISEEKPNSEKKSNKRNILSFIVLIIAIVVLVLSLGDLSDEVQGKIPDVIEQNESCQINEICCKLEIDEGYTLFIFDTADNRIGVSYLKNKKNGIYKYCATYITDDDMIEEKSEYYLSADGKSSKINFIITSKPEDTLSEFDSISFKANNKDYYFYYHIGEKKYHFGNVSALV